MAGLKPFIGLLVRLLLIIAAILGGREIVVRLPMVSELPRIPGIGLSAHDLVTAIAYLGVLALLLGFTMKVAAVIDAPPDAFPWPTLVTHGLILAGVLVAYGNLGAFARALLGPNYWAYSVMLLLLAVIPIFGMGKILYAYISNHIERWER